MRLLLRLALCAGFLAAATAAMADWRPTEMGLPGWRVTTSEDIWARSWTDHTASTLKRYPISNLFDGKPDTAWVFEGQKWRRPEGLTIEGRARPGGGGQWIELTTLGPKPVAVDAVGLINGYAKSADVYTRNNRITRLAVEAGDLWQPMTIKTADLEQTREMQVVRIREVRARTFRVRVATVARGRDDDLCISELQLYHHGRPLVAPPPPYVLYSPGDECGDGYEVFLVDRQGRPAGPRPSGYYWGGYHFAPSGRGVAIEYGEPSERSIAVVDLQTARQVCDRQVIKQPPDGDDTLDSLAWADDRRLRYTVEAAGEKVRYQLDLGAGQPQPRVIERHPVPQQVEPLLPEPIPGLDLPPAAAAALQKALPGWHVMGTSGFDPLVVKWVRQEHGPRAGPQYCRGDFDGDGRPDLALLLRRGSVKLVALLQTGAEQWQVKELRDLGFGEGFQGGFSRFTIYLAPRKPGIVAYWPGDGKGKTGRLRLRHDGIELNWAEKGSTLYYWTGQRFQTVVTGD